MQSNDETYVVKTQREHALDRAAMYIGNVEPTVPDQAGLQHVFLVDDVSNPSPKPLSSFPEPSQSFSDGLHKVVDELFVNAADNARRNADHMPRMTYIKVTLGPNYITVTNNGTPIHVYQSSQSGQEGVWSPTIVFGTFLSGDNFRDSESRTTGGMNGLGAKLSNVFSTEFSVRILDHLRGVNFTQTWTNNMLSVSPPHVNKNASAKSSVTSVTMYPDFSRFGCGTTDRSGWTPTDVGLIKNRLFDLSFCLPDVGVHLKDASGTDTPKFVRIPVKNTKEYVRLCLRASVEGAAEPFVVDTLNERWTVCVARSTEQNGKASSRSFVNSICTLDGGTHVEYLARQIAKKMMQRSRKLKGADVSVGQVRNSMTLFVNAIVENPSFSNQSKTELITKSSQFAKDPKWHPIVSDKFVASILKKTNIVDEVCLVSDQKEQRKLKRGLGGNTGRKRKISGIPKLQDANKAGTRESDRCRLFVVEGDSAATMAVSGMSVVGRDYFGVFPLRGKLINVRGAPLRSILGNKEIQSLIKILGLQAGIGSPTGHGPNSHLKLRYGKIVIMADQDHDGVHIRSLILNFIDAMFPSLIDSGFIEIFITPILKLTRKLNRSSEKGSILFFSEGEYETFVASHGGEEQVAREYTVRYKKGLGSSSASEARSYFRNLGKHLLPMESPVPLSSKDHFRSCFDKSQSNARKAWIEEHRGKSNWYIDFNKSPINYMDFVDKELHSWAAYSLDRAIPSLRDGLKSSQRKILFGCIEKRMTQEVKVASLGAFVSETSHYKHGETSMYGAIIGMAQHFVGSNNLNMLSGMGQFGTRLHGGSDHASPRYIFASLSESARLVYKLEDDRLLRFKREEGYQIEPHEYSPIVPTILVNGCAGIASGWSTSVPNHSVLDVVHLVENWIDRAEKRTDTGASLTEERRIAIHPHYEGFRGTIVPKIPLLDSGGEHPKRWITSGTWEWVDETAFRITELPVGLWTDPYREYLTKSMDEGTKMIPKGSIVDVRNNSTDECVDFVITLSPEFASRMHRRDPSPSFEKAFKLTTELSFNNAHLLDSDGRPVKFDSAHSIVDAWAPGRLALYVVRKTHMIDSFEAEVGILKSKRRFIQAVNDGTVQMKGKTRKEIASNMQSIGILDKASKTACFNMSITSFTKEKVDTLNGQIEEKNKSSELIRSKSPSELWRDDLKDLQRHVRVLGHRDGVNENNGVAVGHKQRRRVDQFRERPKKIRKKLSNESSLTSMIDCRLNE